MLTKCGLKFCKIKKKKKEYNHIGKIKGDAVTDLLHQKALLQEKGYINIKYNNVIINFRDRLDKNRTNKPARQDEIVIDMHTDFWDKFINNVIQVKNEIYYS